MRNIYAEPGTKVRFTAKGGHQSEKESAQKILSINETYTVVSTIVHRSFSEVCLEEEPYRSFNTCLFEEVE